MAPLLMMHSGVTLPNPVLDIVAAPSLNNGSSGFYGWVYLRGPEITAYAALFDFWGSCTAFVYPAQPDGELLPPDTAASSRNPETAHVLIDTDVEARERSWGPASI